ncbi:tRNA (guanine-N(7)-)-methyltransferase [bacterium HR17]|jgi:tRNA (guanine-N7-)-methyltransferase|uniref:tRNA (guanine-N(7)-)-methyltransferase n=1 Tax=Candidatus Fervidibacter japonicus TaxID=2035412 RepID=A0A2H5X9A1_9BACT|nr:tRNA (guanine-N(7)-)-methyltransferase [bacterium HR17]
MAAELPDDVVVTLDGIVLRPTALPVRPDWSHLFGRDAPLLLEIGVGNGEFLVWLAQRFPDANCVGVEVARKFLLKARNRVRQAGVTNVRLLPMEGSHALSRLFAPDSLTALYLNFPDPWHKRRHHKRRLVDAAFAWLLASRLREGGTFIAVTDDEPYAQEVLAAFSACPAYAPLWTTPLRHELPDYYATKYARKWKAQGRRLFYLGFRKVRQVDQPEWLERIYPLAVLRGDEPMPQVTLQVSQPVDWEQLRQHIPRQTFRHSDECVIVVKDAYRGDDRVLVDVIVAEGKLTQRFFVVAHPHSDGILLRLHEVGCPDPTKGVHRAVALLARTVMASLPGATVKHTTCLPAVWRAIDLGG